MSAHATVALATVLGEIQARTRTTRRGAKATEIVALYRNRSAAFKRLKKLVADGLVEQLPSGGYVLTPAGIARYHTEKEAHDH